MARTILVTGATGGIGLAVCNRLAKAGLSLVPSSSQESHRPKSWHYASSDVLRCTWLAEAKTLAFALGERGIRVSTLSLGGTLTPGYAASLEKRAVNTGTND